MPEYYELPDISAFDDIQAWIPLLLTAIDGTLNTPSAFPDSWPNAQGLIQDLIAYVSQLSQLGTSMRYVGEIITIATNTVPEGFLLCDGALVSRTTYSALFSVIGTTYGVGDGVTTFALPDMRGRVSVGSGSGPSLTPRILGATFGTETHTLTVDEMPSHAHGMQFKTAIGTDLFTIGRGNGNRDNPLQTASAGGGQAHNNMQPSIVFNFAIYHG